MTKSEVLTAIQKSLDEILEAKSATLVQVTPDMPVLDGPADIDSLDLAQIVLELQSVTGLDPFAEGFVEFQTFDELASLFSA